MEQSYRSTISIYKSILEQFNPALENLVYLGNKYVRAFHALSEAADVYFTAIQKIGEQALQSSTSQILGEILIQMSDTQMHLNRNLEVVAQTFHMDLLQHMEKNTKLDMQFINDSRQRYEKEYRHRAANIDKCMSDLWRMERMRDKNAREMKENMMHLHTEMQAFVSESQQAAELEEKRRYRFLAEKHQLLSNTFLQFYTRARAIIQNKVPLWKEQLEATRNPAQNLLSTAHSQGHPSGRLTPTPMEMPQRPLSDFSSVMAGRSFSPFLQETVETLPSSQPEPRRRPLSRTPSVAILSGWFPEAFVKPLVEVRDHEDTATRTFPLRSSHSVNDLLDRSSAPPASDHWPNASRPQSPSPSPSSALPGAGSRRSSTANAATTTDSKKPTGVQHPPELFPKGTNPFATVKLRPTVTNDRSAPIIK
ncbi:brain-specific angiogenesis inhibitor 1-associated protein 2-like protein 2 [Sceloporus undulatus]|uniref:brain-specific angiogenesis inhibitor 1-associated protein 2-like protein 2 n=1 Tax=Sceloporus undulatus TaxID=8520 RepID=UPI001C4AB043|nr:brain-specific angiogenesis inhibitor 1-associated protein 2-like protein 2 [Sceloporus undulatus]